MTPINLFVGYDPREKIGFHVFCHTLLKHATRPVSITPLAQLGMDSGSNTFTLSRFLVPYLMSYKGYAIFMDGCDMMMLGDIAELDAMFNRAKAVQVVKHRPYKSKHTRKYVGTVMECDQSNYERKNWMSTCIVNCEHPAWSGLDPNTLSDHQKLDLLQLRFIDDVLIGHLPDEWNVLVDEGQSAENAKVLHWTAGSPMFPHYFSAPFAREWHDQKNSMVDVAV